MFRVVIADDSIEFSDWLGAVLDKSDDFQLAGIARTGLQACRLLESEIPDLVISDVYMPDMDGMELARYIRRHFPGMIVILISAHGENVFETQADEEGAVAFIPKAKLSLNTIRELVRGAGKQ